MNMDAYKRLAEHLDALPNGFPATADGRELKLLAKIYTPEQADLAAQLSPEFESADVIARRVGGEAAGLHKKLKAMARRGLIEAGRVDGMLGFKSMPFIVGVYEMQVQRMDAELAQLFEDYFLGGFGRMLAIEPYVHRVVPAHETVDTSVEVLPFESAAEIVYGMEAWGVQDCICRKQKALIGQACEHPLDVCLAMDSHPHAFDGSTTFRALTRDEAMKTLRRCSEAGLVHTVSNSAEGTVYICNCCKCSCGILRGMADLGLANVVARSAFVNRVDEDLCIGCEDCVPVCQFEALVMQDALAVIDADRCVGCGVCVLACAADALVLVRRPADEVKPVPLTQTDWKLQRLAARGL